MYAEKAKSKRTSLALQLKPIFLSVLASLFFSLVVRGFVMTEKWYDHTTGNTGDGNPILLP